MKNVLDLIGRLLVGGFFINEAYDCIARPVTTKAKMVSYGITWQPELLLWVGAFCVALGSLLLVLGYRSRLAAALLLVYWLPVSFAVHPLWNVPVGELREVGLSLLRYLAIAGALLLIVAHGTGRYAVRKVLAAANR